MLDPREVRQAIEIANRVEEGLSGSEIDLAPIQLLQENIEEIIVLARALSSTIDAAAQLYTKGQVGPVIAAAATDNDYPADSYYPKGWWANTIIPQILALQSHFSTEVAGVSPNEIFYAKPPKSLS